MINIDQLLSYNCQANIGDMWVVARPEPYHSIWTRLRDTWAVLTGRAMAITFTGQ